MENMVKVVLNNGIEMPILGFGVFQLPQNYGLRMPVLRAPSKRLKSRWQSCKVIFKQIIS